MNKGIKSFFVANKDNTTVAFGSNLKDMHDMLLKIEPEARNYMYYYRKFQETNSIQWKEYQIQKII